MTTRNPTKQCPATLLTGCALYQHFPSHCYICPSFQKVGGKHFLLSYLHLYVSQLKQYTFLLVGIILCIYIHSRRQQLINEPKCPANTCCEPHISLCQSLRTPLTQTLNKKKRTAHQGSDKANSTNHPHINKPRHAFHTFSKGT